MPPSVRTLHHATASIQADYNGDLFIDWRIIDLSALKKDPERNKRL